MTIETITIDTEQWAVVPRRLTAENGAKAALMGEFHEMAGSVRVSVSWPTIKEIWAKAVDVVAAPQPEQAQLSDAWAPHSINYDRSIHSNPSAEAWAALFIQTFPGLADKHDLMLGWFANAMMAMHDHLMQQPAPPNVQRPVPISERLPTAADADVTESVWLFNKMVRKWYLYHWRDVETAYISHWQPTGIVRPAEPDGGAV